VTKLEGLKAQANEKRGKEAHITDEEIDGALAKVAEVEKWAQGEMDAFNTKPPHQDSDMVPTAFDAKLAEAAKAVATVVKKKPPPPPKKEEEKKDEAKPAEGAAEPAAEAPPKEGEAESPKGPKVQMDMD